MTEKTYNTLEAAVLLGLKKYSVKNAIVSGRLAAYRDRDHGPWRITKRAIDNYLATRRLNPVD